MKFLKLRKSRLSIGLLAIVFIFACSLAQPAEVSAASTEESQNLKRWMRICQNMADKIEKKHFVYNPNKAGSTYKKALKNGKGSSCAYYASWCLQKYGALKSGQVIHMCGTSFHANFKKNKANLKNLEVIRVNKKASRVNLKEGDIVMWKDHTNIYAGENSSGERLWYDAGRQTTYGHCYGSRFRNLGKITESFLDSWTIRYIIRIKDL